AVIGEASGLSAPALSPLAPAFGASRRQKSGIVMARRSVRSRLVCLSLRPCSNGGTMRKQLRTRMGISIVGATMFAAWMAACSGSDEQEVITAPDAAPEASADTSKP